MQKIKAKIYQYSKNSFIIDEVKLNSEVLNETFPDYAISNDIHSIYYEQGSKSNYIKYKNGTTQELGNYEPFYEKQFAKVRLFEFKCKEAVNLKKLNTTTTKYKISILDIFKESNITKRKKLVKNHELERQSYTLTNKKIFRFLNKYKKRRLKSSDWTQSLDVQNQMNDVQKADWVAYRQALRELDNISNPIKEVILPIEPQNPLT